MPFRHKKRPDYKIKKDKKHIPKATALRSLFLISLICNLAFNLIKYNIHLSANFIKYYFCMHQVQSNVFFILTNDIAYNNLSSNKTDHWF